MELASCCTYCQSLDVLDRSRRGEKTRCPLCKCDLWKTAAATYRLPLGGVAARPARVGVWIAGCVVLAAIVAISTLAFRATTPKSTPVAEIAEAPAATPQPVDVAIPAAVERGAAKSNVNVLVGISTSKRTTAKPRPAVKLADGRTIVAHAPPAVNAAIAPLPSSVPPTKDLPPAKSTLTKVPELIHVPIVKSPGSTTIEQLRKLAAEIEVANTSEHDAYVRKLRDERADLRGLPFVMGDACKLTAEASKDLAKFSMRVNQAVGAGRNVRSSQYPWADYHGSTVLAAYVTGDRTTTSPSERKPLPRAALSALDQILAPEAASFRAYVVDQFKNDTSPAATKSLARRAVFELEDGVRRAAATALAKHDKDRYVDDLIAGFRHPWQRAAWHAAEAIVELKRTDLIDRLELLRNEPAPETPVARADDRYETRELVRVNHHKNCFLCHPPATKQQVDDVIRSRGDGDPPVPVGLAPDPSEAMPAISGPIYYSRSRSGGQAVFVRADITYLRQDFSLTMPVPNPGLWPELQRFDFFVRTNTLTEDQAKGLPTPRLDDVEAGAAIRYAIAELRKLP